jgi:hypothetical protein
MTAQGSPIFFPVLAGPGKFCPLPFPFWVVALTIVAELWCNGPCLLTFRGAGSSAKLMAGQ